MRHSLLLVLATAVWVGCYDFGSVSGQPPSEGGASSGSGSGAVGDGGAGESGGSSGSSSGGASSGGDASAAFCASLSPAPTFCEDFEQASWASHWDQLIQQNGSVTVDSVLPFSNQPDSLLTQTSAALSGQATEADALKQLAAYQGKAIHLTASFEMNVQEWDSASSGQVIAFEIIFKNSSAQFNQIVLNLGSLGSTGVTAQIAENAQGVDGGGAGYNSYPFGTHPPTKQWTKIDVDLVVASPTGSGSNVITVKLDGAPQLSQQALGVPLQGGVPWVHLGIGYVATPSSGWAVRYDNLVVDVTTL